MPPRLHQSHWMFVMAQSLRSLMWRQVGIRRDTAVERARRTLRFWRRQGPPGGCLMPRPRESFVGGFFDCRGARECSGYALQDGPASVQPRSLCNAATRDLAHESADIPADELRWENVGMRLIGKDRGKPVEIGARRGVPDADGWSAIKNVSTCRCCAARWSCAMAG